MFRVWFIRLSWSNIIGREILESVQSATRVFKGSRGEKWDAPG